MTGWSPAFPKPFVDPATTLEAATATLPAAFDAVVAAHGTRVAIEDEGGETTYSDLCARSRAVATALRNVDRDRSPVVIAAAHGTPAITAILGAARAGRPYAILDLTAPDDYRVVVATQVDARVVITDSEHHEIAAALGDRVTLVSLDDLPLPATSPAEIPIRPVDPLAISFTSGSSGSPKAVVHSHRNVVVNGLRFAAANGMDPADRVLVSLPLQFTASATSVYSALLTGATGLYCDLASGGLEVLAQFVEDTAPTVVQLAPAQILPLARHLRRVGTVPSVRLVNIGGDHLEGSDVDQVFATFPEARVLYRYNTSETNWVAGLVVQPTDSQRDAFPAGWAVPWADVRVVGDTGADVSPGSPGELWVGGEHLALGYWGDDARTTDRFVVDGATRWYRTGDQVTRATDGLLTHLHRNDRTVKVNGVLVDPARIENCLATLPGITDVAVAPFDDDGQTRLAAFLVGREYPATIVRSHVAASLPRTMVPQRVAMLDALPISTRGKTDTAALRALATQAPTGGPPAASVEPMDATETAIAAIFRDVLGAGPVGRDDDFFALGGDSLATLELADQFGAEFGIELELSALLEHPTPADLARWMRERSPTHRHLVRVSPGTDDLTPVVFFPGAGGAGIYDLMPMIGLLPERPCYSVIPHAFEHRGLPDRTVPRMAARVVPDIVALAARSQVVLVGRSSGGYTAIETARQLAALGHPPALVVLLDTNGPGRPRFRRFKRGLELEFAIPRRSIWRRAYRVAGVAMHEPASAYRRMTAGWVPRRGEPQRRAFVTVVHRAVGRYEGAPYAGDVLLIRARDRQTDGRQLRWGEFVLGDFEVVDVPGRHSNLVRGEYLHTTLVPITARLVTIDEHRNESA